VFFVSRIWEKLNGGSRVASNIFEKQLWFSEVEALHVYELQFRIRKQLAVAHFEEAVEDDDQFREIGRKSSANNIFRTLAIDFLTEALERLFQN
jgi:hypothetical protein